MRRVVQAAANRPRAKTEYVFGSSVVVAGVSARMVPLPNAVRAAEVDKQAHALDLLRERSLLFVACTRAREDLVVTWNGQPSEFLG